MSPGMRAAFDAPASAVFVRVAVGGVALIEGVQHLFGRGHRLFSAPELLFPTWFGAALGTLELALGLLVVFGCYTRRAAAALLLLLSAVCAIEMWSLLSTGCWSAIYEVRASLALGCSTLFLVAAGPGPLSVDARRAP